MVKSFFKLPGYSVFNYQPRYYDPEKERREQRRRQLRMEQGKDPDYNTESASTEDRIRGRMKYRIEPIRKAKRMSNFRLLLIAAVLVLIAFSILYL